MTTVVTRGNPRPDARTVPLRTVRPGVPVWSWALAAGGAGLAVLVLVGAVLFGMGVGGVWEVVT